MANAGVLWVAVEDRWWIVVLRILKCGMDEPLPISVSMVAESVLAISLRIAVVKLPRWVHFGDKKRSLPHSANFRVWKECVPNHMRCSCKCWKTDPCLIVVMDIPIVTVKPMKIRLQGS